jgi:hypothetical protein
MAQDQPEDRAPSGETRLDDDDAGRQVAYITGMSAEAAATFAAFHSGRYAHCSAFRVAA